MKKPKSGVSVSKLQVLEAISDHISIKLLDEIAKNTTTSDSHMQKLNISRKQYYDRSSRLLKTDLIKLVDGRFTLTAFGKLVYHAELKILERSIALRN